MKSATSCLAWATPVIASTVSRSDAVWLPALSTIAHSAQHPTPLGVRGRSVVVRKASPVRWPLLQEGVAALDRFIGHVRQPGSFARKDLLADHPIVDRIEGELQHPLCRRALATYDLGPVQADGLQLIVRHDGIDHAHPIGILRTVGAAQEEDFSGKLLPHLTGQVGGAEAGVEGADIGVRLLEASLLGTGQAQVAHHVQAVPTPGRPAVDEGDHDLGHEADQPLDLQNVQPTHRCRTYVGWLVSHRIRVTGAGPDSLITAAAECPPAVLWRRAVAGQQYCAHVGRRPRVVKCRVKLVDRVRPEGVTHLRPVERHPYHRQADRAVVRDVAELKSGHYFPQLGLEWSRHVIPDRRPASWWPSPSWSPHWRRVVVPPCTRQLWPRRPASSGARAVRCRRLAARRRTSDLSCRCPHCRCRSDRTRCRTGGRRARWPWSVR